MFEVEIKRAFRFFYNINKIVLTLKSCAYRKLRKTTVYENNNMGTGRSPSLRKPTGCL